MESNKLSPGKNANLIIGKTSNTKNTLLSPQNIKMMLSKVKNAYIIYYTRFDGMERLTLNQIERRLQIKLCRNVP